MVLKLYYDLMSQPSRACWMFLKLNNIPFESCPIALRKFENRTEKYSAINPFQLVPVLDDDGYVLTESNAILRYLALKYKTPEHWYPSNDLKKQGRIDEYLNWHHWNVRLNGSMVFRTKVIDPMLSGQEVDQKKLETFRYRLIGCTDQFEQYFLGKTPFISSNEISVADIQALVEFMQVAGAGYDIFAGRPRLAAWRDRVKPLLQPYFDEAHVFILKVPTNRLGMDGTALAKL